MYLSDSNIETPNGHTIIWRYMGIDKFLHLITTKKLFFCRLSKMTDKFEGSLPKDNFTKRLNQLSKNQDKDVFETARQERMELEKFKNYTFVNCWSIGREESYALWKIYLQGSACGVAIKSTVSKLRKSIESVSDEVSFYLGKVNYTNFIKEDPLTQLSLTTTKSLYYEYENELRAFFITDETVEKSNKILSLIPGWNVEIDINILIDQIYISPFTGSWFKDSFIDIIEKVHPNFTRLIKVSNIQDQ
jgi:hypothetical protein